MAGPGAFGPGKRLPLDFGPGIRYNIPCNTPVCRNGRRGGLKIPCANNTCGFDPHHRHQKSRTRQRSGFLLIAFSPRAAPFVRESTRREKRKNKGQSGTSNPGLGRGFLPGLGVVSPGGAGRRRRGLKLAQIPGARGARIGPVKTGAPALYTAAPDAVY